MDELANPYRPGAGLPPPELAGRDSLLSSFQLAVQRAREGRPGKSVMPTGLRGVGKTVLLRKFARIAEAQGLLVAEIEAPETGDFQRILANRIRRVLIDLTTNVASRAANVALRVFKSFTLTLPHEVGFKLDVQPLAGRADSSVLADDLTDLLIATGEAAQESKRGLLLSIDEIQYLSSEEFAGIITALHATSQRDLPIVLVGAGLPQLPKLAGEAKSYSERLFRFPRIGSLSHDDARRAIVDPAAEVRVSYSDDAFEAIYAKTQGYPYFLQEWAYYVWNAAPRPDIDLAVVAEAEPSIIQALDEDFFSVRFDRLRPSEKRYLEAMATLGPGPHRSTEIARSYGAPNVQAVARLRQDLIDKGMLFSQEHGETAFTVPLFDEFLLRKMDPC